MYNALASAILLHKSHELYNVQWPTLQLCINLYTYTLCIYGQFQALRNDIYRQKSTFKLLHV